MKASDITTKKNKEKLLIALEQSLGIVTPACKACAPEHSNASL